MKRLIVLIAMATACESADKEETSELELENEESTNCSPASHPALLQVWSSQQDESNIADIPPLCEAQFAVEITDNDGLYSIGDCEFQGGQSTRVLSYEFLGTLQEDGRYNGEVVLTKRNGETELASFDAVCEEVESEVSFELGWTMLVTTPHGQVEHTGVLATE